MADKLFLLEFHVGVINFDIVLEPTPKKEHVLVNIRFSEMNIDVDPDALPFFPQADEGGPIDFNMGKSYLFLYNPKNLISDLKREPIELSVRVHNKTEGSAIIKWVDDFCEMVKLNEKIGVVKAVDYKDNIQLKNKMDEMVGTAEFFVRLTCFANSIETQYQMKTMDKKKEYFFRDPKSPNVFKCEKYQIADSEILPVAPLLNPVIKPSGSEPENRYSWHELFGGSEITSKVSEAPFSTLEPGMQLDQIFERTSGDTVSICFRPLENKFFDFLNMVTTEVSASPDNTTVTFTKGGQGGKKSFMKPDKRDENDPLELTADRINRMLCKNRDCPAAIKFKEFGIGPLATGKGLGTLYGEVDPPIDYGLSHTYGTMSNYGPYGVFSRPKRLDQPFIPSKNALETKQPPCSNRKEKCCDETKKPPMRLRGGGVLDEENTWETKSFLSGKSSRSWDHYVPWSRRLRGGGPLGLENMLEPKSPFLECKSVMDQFDYILAAYKKAIGPCGEATCPYAQSMAEESCKKMCEKNKLPEPPKEEDGSCSDVPCDIPTCPYKDSKKYPAGCGRPTCAYTQHKLGLVDDDAALELEFLPPAVSGKCGHPKCHYPFQPPLPPIHWDCPDPLPKGNCRNPNCPFQPPDLKKLKCPVPKKGPCGSPDCPYALPPPCELPTCPFKPKPVCPFLEKQKKKKKRRTCCPPEEEDEEVCENPECPFVPKEPRVKGQFTTCGNPDCPFATKPESESKNSICDNPKCPFAPPKPKKKQQGCGSPSCPFAPKPPKKESHSCGDPNCPFAPKPKPRNGGSCGDPNCPFAPKEQDDCGDPSCPFASKKPKDDNGCGDPDCPFTQKPEGDNCGDPDCPFTPKPPKPKNDTCGDPNCPFAPKSDSESDECDNPDCPFKQTKTKDTCDNPECPSNLADDFSTESSEICDNPDCPYAQKEVEPICTDPYCPYLMPLPSCGIPYCPFEPRVCPPPPPCPKPKPAPPKPTTVQQTAPTIRVETTSIVPGNQGNVAEQEVNVGQGDSRKKRSNANQGDSKGPGKGKGNGKGNGTGNGKGKGKDNGKGTGDNGNGKRKKRSKFVYTMCNRYPGVKVGHKECITPLFNVPAKMGWLWNIPYGFLRLKPRRGWKPGALTRFMAAKIKAHRQAQGLGLLQVPKFKRKGKGGRGGDGGSEVSVSPKPTLQIQKKDGAYWITMNPLKDPKTLAENENPYMECTPMQFKITKNKKKREEGEDDESRLCYCEDEDDSSSSSDSELDIEFTPPAGIIHPERFKKKKDVVHCDTQYDPKDFASKDKKGKGKDKKGKGGGGKADKKKK